MTPLCGSTIGTDLGTCVACKVNGQQGDGLTQGTCTGTNKCQPDGSCKECSADFITGSSGPHKGCDLLNPICDTTHVIVEPVLNKQQPPEPPQPQPTCVCNVNGPVQCDTKSSRCDATSPGNEECKCGTTDECTTPTIPACLTDTQMTPAAGDSSATTTCQVCRYHLVQSFGKNTFGFFKD